MCVLSDVFYLRLTLVSGRLWSEIVTPPEHLLNYSYLLTDLLID